MLRRRWHRDGQGFQMQKANDDDDSESKEMMSSNISHKGAPA
jgi:hypothetical protein